MRCPRIFIIFAHPVVMVNMWSTSPQALNQSCHSCNPAYPTAPQQGPHKTSSPVERFVLALKCTGVKPCIWELGPTVDYTHEYLHADILVNDGFLCLNLVLNTQATLLGK